MLNKSNKITFNDIIIDKPITFDDIIKDNNDGRHVKEIDKSIEFYKDIDKGDSAVIDYIDIDIPLVIEKSNDNITIKAMQRSGNDIPRKTRNLLVVKDRNGVSIKDSSIIENDVQTSSGEIIINESEFDNYVEISLYNAKQTSILEKKRIYKAKEPINIEILSSNGSMFRNGEIQTTLSGKVFIGQKDVTDEFFGKYDFLWKKYNKDGIPDEAWNNAHITSSKQLTLTNDDVDRRAVFDLEIHDRT
jgi:hypothetical protein